MSSSSAMRQAFPRLSTNCAATRPVTALRRASRAARPCRDRRAGVRPTRRRRARRRRRAAPRCPRGRRRYRTGSGRAAWPTRVRSDCPVQFGDDAAHVRLPARLDPTAATRRCCGPARGSPTAEGPTPTTTSAIFAVSVTGADLDAAPRGEFHGRRTPLVRGVCQRLQLRWGDDAAGRRTRARAPSAAWCSWRAPGQASLLAGPGHQITVRPCC